MFLGLTQNNDVINLEDSIIYGTTYIIVNFVQPHTGPTERAVNFVARAEFSSLRSGVVVTFFPFRVYDLCAFGIMNQWNVFDEMKSNPRWRNTWTDSEIPPCDGNFDFLGFLCVCW